MPASVALNSRGFAGFRRCFSRGGWLPSLCCCLSRFGRWFDDRRQFQLGLFCSAMMPMVQRLDACGFFFHPQLSVAILLALILTVFRNRFRCHGQSVAEPAPSKLSNLALCQLSARDGVVEVRLLAKFRGYEPSNSKTIRGNEQFCTVQRRAVILERL